MFAAARFAGMKVWQPLQVVLDSDLVAGFNVVIDEVLAKLRSKLRSASKSTREPKLATRDGDHLIGSCFSGTNVHGEGCSIRLEVCRRLHSW